MQHLRFMTPLLFGLLGPACAPAGPGSLERGPLADLSTGEKADKLTAAPTAAEQVGKADGFDPRDDYPAAYGFTKAPNAPSVLAGEFEPVDSLLLGWGDGAWENEQLLVDILAAVIPEVDVTLVVPREADMNYIDEDLRRVGLDADRVSYVLFPVDSIWMRDYGPLGVVSTTGKVTFIDPRYYWGRWNDDFFPTAYAADENRAVSRPPIEMEGGNILSDGQGRCVTTDVNPWRNAAFGYGTADIRALFQAYFGCSQTTIVPALEGEGTGHVDMFVHITAPGEAIVGAYDPAEDPVNAARTDKAAERLVDHGFKVRRVGMPSNEGQRVFRSYTNALAVNGVVLVPVYAADRRYEAHALKVFAEAFPGRKIVPVLSDEIIEWAGAVHCVTMTF